MCCDGLDPPSQGQGQGDGRLVARLEQGKWTINNEAVCRTAPATSGLLNMSSQFRAVATILSQTLVVGTLDFAKHVNPLWYPADSANIQFE